MCRSVGDRPGFRHRLPPSSVAWHQQAYCVDQTERMVRAWLGMDGRLSLLWKRRKIEKENRAREHEAGARYALHHAATDRRDRRSDPVRPSG